MPKITVAILVLLLLGGSVLAWNVFTLETDKENSENEDTRYLTDKMEVEKNTEDKHEKKEEKYNEGDNGDKEQEKDNVDDSKDEADDSKDEVGDSKDKKEAKTESGDREISPKYEKDELVHKLQHFESPIEGATITNRESQLPGAPRHYRNGIHEGVDYYNGYVNVSIDMGTPILSVADGTVRRADHGYEELTHDKHEEILNEARAASITPERILDKLRGKQVWIEHEDGIITRYAHLDSIPDDIENGVGVEKGQHIGSVGNSGTSHGVDGTNSGAHLHFEIWLSDDYYLGKDMEPMEVREVLVEIF